jgi:hypothetical protein
MAKTETITLNAEQLLKIIKGGTVTIGKQPLMASVDSDDIGILAKIRDEVEDLIEEAEEEENLDDLDDEEMDEDMDDEEDE